MDVSLDQDVAIGNWAAQELAEFMSFVTGQTDPDSAAARAVERVAEVIEAEVACVARPGVSSHTVGLPAGREDELAALLLSDPGQRVVLPVIGSCAVLREPLDATRLEWLVVARVGDGRYSPEERDLLRGMARVIGLAREMLNRRRLLERISEIQRRIVRRDAIDEIIELIVAGAAELTGSEVALLREAEHGPDGPFRVKGCIGLSQEALALLTSSPGRGVSRHAQRENRLIVVPDYQNHPGASPLIQAEGIQSMVGAPVSAGNEVTGALLVASRAPGRTYSDAELSTLQMFAEHASVALSDARLVADAVHRSLHDALTGLPNRALFAERLAAAMGHRRAADESVSVLFVDLDRFKTINDSLGHNTGDELLIAAAQRLATSLAGRGMAARLGGDEFAVLIENADELEGQRLADHILAEFERPFMIGGHELAISVSIGIAVGRGPDDDPLMDGDLAMYDAKTGGRARASVFRPEMRTVAQNRLAMEIELHAAPARGELFVEYQPIIDLASGETAMVEALVRWNHPYRGRLEPGAFLPLAEQTRQISALGAWVLRAVCRQAAQWRRQLPTQQLRVAVNLSAAQLHSGDIVADVASALAENDLAPGCLALELTETAIMADVDSAVRRLAELRGLGVSLAIDDFGTGYCSLQYLQRFPIDYLKIARPFIADLAGPDPDLRMIRAIAALGSGWEIDLVAEGIERSDQLSALSEIGCRFGQGFLLGAPAPAGALAL